MNKKPPVKPTPVKRPVKPPVVSPPAPPAPVWTRLELPSNCARFDTDTLPNHAGAIVSSFDTNGVHIADNNYGKGYVNIIPPIGNWQEQVATVSPTAVITYKNTTVRINQVQAGVNYTTSVNLTLDGGVGPAKLMRYLLNQESL